MELKDPLNNEPMSVAEKNDWLRSQLPILPRPHRLILTAGVASLPADNIEKLIAGVRNFSDFTEDNDPYGEHDFGSLSLDGHKFFWKFDLYDEALRYYQENGIRVLTIMFADEY